MLPRVALLVVTLDGRDHLERLLASVAELDYPRDQLDIIVVDNASTDGTQAWLADKHPDVRVIALPRNEGFARPNNLAAAAAADADLLALVNNDMRLDPQWLRAAVAGLEDESVACIATRILNWDGTRVDYAGAGMTFDGFGLQPSYGADSSRVTGEEGPVLFACGGAMVIRRATFLALDGFDERFFAYFEDVDLGWRLWTSGHRVHYRPQAVSWHVHNGTSARFPSEAKRLLMERNALQMVLKNHEDDGLLPHAVAALLLTASRAAIRGHVDETSFRMAEAPTPLPGPGAGALIGKIGQVLHQGGVRGVFRAASTKVLRTLLARLEGGAAKVHEGQVVVAAEAWAGILAMRDVAAMLPDLWERRRQVQGRRVRSDKDLVPMMQHPLMAIEGGETYARLHEGLCKVLGLRDRYAAP